MIKVGLVTGWADYCGITQYGHHMLEYIPNEDIEIKVLSMNFASAIGHASSVDIMVLNESGYSMFGFSTEVLERIKRKAKTVLILHASNPTDNRNDFTKLFDRVVHHEKTAVDGFTYIPQGCPVNDFVKYPDYEGVGINGFPLNHKNIPNLARACKRVGMKLRALIPDSHHASANAVEKQIQETEVDAETNKNWLSDKEMISLLSLCDMVCYPYWNSTPGPSASALMGVAAHRPVIVSKCNQFKHWFDRDEIYFIESDAPSVDQIAEALIRVKQDSDAGRAKIPHKIYEESNWLVVAQKYRQVFTEMMQ